MVRAAAEGCLFAVAGCTVGATVELACLRPGHVHHWHHWHCWYHDDRWWEGDEGYEWEHGVDER
jgi:hypothetical protein